MNAYVHDAVLDYENLTERQKRNLVLLVWLVPLWGAIHALLSPHNPNRVVDFGSSKEIGDFRLLYFPDSHAETSHIESELIAAGIPYFIQNRYLGDLLPGPQLPWYNERRIFVPGELLEEAFEVVQTTRIEQGFSTATKSWRQLPRLILETVIFGWFVPGDRHPRSDNKSLNTDAGNAGAG